MLSHRYIITSIYITVLSFVAAIVLYFWQPLAVMLNPSCSPVIKHIRADLNDFSCIIVNKESLSQDVFLHYYIALIFLFIVLCFISINVLFIVLVMRRIIKFRKEITNAAKEEYIQQQVIQYLYTDRQAETLENLRHEPKKVVIDQLLALYVDIIGNKADLVRQLFFQLKLDEYVYLRCNNYYWHVRVKYMDIASIMKIRTVKDIAQKYIHSSNPLMRSCAIKAYLNLDLKHSFDYLHEFKKTISEWNQINLYQLVVRQSIPVPSFYQYLSSDNPTVVCFALKMIQLNIQTDGSREALLRLLQHPASSVRKEAIITMRILYVTEAVAPLISMYKDEDEVVRMEIIRTLAKLDTEEAVPFLTELLRHENFSVKMEVLKNISLVHRNNILAQFESDKEVVAIVQHVSDRRIMF